MVSFDKSKYGDYLILNCQEVMAWFLDKRKENQNYCGCCEKRKCFVCQRFDYIKKQFQENAYFETQDWPHQSILWEIFDKFEKEPNSREKNIYRFHIYIERTVRSDSLVKKYEFLNDKIIETL